MTYCYHVTIRQDGDRWQAHCPALAGRGAKTGGETREEALTHIESILVMILTEMEASGAPPPPDEPVSGGILLTIET